jgi:mono/diheme cytochrome c family protein
MIDSFRINVAGLLTATFLMSHVTISEAYTNAEVPEGDYTNGVDTPYNKDGLQSWVDGKPYEEWIDPAKPSDGPSWSWERNRRNQAIEAYLNETGPALSDKWEFRQTGDQPQNSALGWKWFQESPVGFGGVPFVLLKTLIDLNADNCKLDGQFDICGLVGVWQKKPNLAAGLEPTAKNLDHLGFGPHPDDYDENGRVRDPGDRKWPLPYGFVFQSGNPKLPDDVGPFEESIETLVASTYSPGLLEANQLRKLETSTNGKALTTEQKIDVLNKRLDKKFRHGKVSLALAKLKGQFAQRDILGLYGDKSETSSTLARFYEDDASKFGRSTGLDRVFFSCAACHVGRVNTKEHGIVHLPGAPNTEVQAQYFSELLMLTGSALIKSGFDVTSPEPPTDVKKIKPNTDLIVGLFKAMLHKARHQPESLYGQSPQQILRSKFMAVRVAWNFPMVIKELIGTAVKTHYVYRIVAGNNAYNSENLCYADSNQPLPELINYRIGQMDAFGIASGLGAIHMLRPDRSFLKFLFSDPLKTLGQNLGDSEAFRGFKGTLYLNDSRQELGADLAVLEYDDKLEAAKRRVIDPANIALWAPPLPAPIDIKSMFFSRDRSLANWDGNQAASARALASGTSATGDPRRVNVEIHEPLNPFINHLPPSPYLWDIDLEKAAKGRTIFKQNKCGACHQSKRSVVIPAAKLGVDRARSLTNTPVSRHLLAGLVLESCNIYYENNPNKPGNDFCLPVGETQQDRLEDYFSDIPKRVAKGTNGYKADALHGIWTRAPYLHNGSVPTLAALICSAARPEKFLRGVINYDTDLVGFEWLEKPTTRYNSVHELVSFDDFDTRVLSRSNSGHNYGEDLCPTELKTLDPISDRQRMTDLMLGLNRDTDLAHLLEYLKTL